MTSRGSRNDELTLDFPDRAQLRKTSTDEAVIALRPCAGSIANYVPLCGGFAFAFEVVSQLARPSVATVVNRSDAHQFPPGLPSSVQVNF